MASPQRILVLGTSHGGGNWPPLAAVIVGLHQAGHAVQCFGDPAIAHDLAAAAITVPVVPLWWERPRQVPTYLGARHDLTAQRLAAAIGRVLGNPHYQGITTRIPSHLQTRDAVATVRTRIEALLETT
jgi:hypothetical protein